MARETIEQMTARLTKEDEAKEEIFHERLKEIKADNSRWRAEKVKKERAEEREREKLHEDLRLKRERR
jgi:hypothetical protein